MNAELILQTGHGADRAEQLLRGGGLVRKAQGRLRLWGPKPWPPFVATCERSAATTRHAKFKTASSRGSGAAASLQTSAELGDRAAAAAELG